MHVGLHVVSILLVVLPAMVVLDKHDVRRAWNALLGRPVD